MVPNENDLNDPSEFLQKCNSNPAAVSRQATKCPAQLPKPKNRRPPLVKHFPSRRPKFEVCKGLESMSSANTACASTSKTTPPNLAVWRFVDGKPGHERQTEGLLRALSEFIRLTVTNVPVSGGIFCWATKLRHLLKHPENHPDLLVGAGHKTHFPMILCRPFTKAKSVVLMKPSLPRCCFDFCIASSHDDVSASDHRTLIVRGVLNPLTPSQNHDPKKGLILLGGPCRHVQWSDEAILRQVQQIASQIPEVQWIATASRRTPLSLREKLQSLAVPNLCYVPPTETDPNWMPEHLGRASQTWVSPDSVSMIHEALTAGCRVGVFDLPWKKNSKWKTALEELAHSTLWEYSPVMIYSKWKTALEELAQAGRVILYSQLNAGSWGGGLRSRRIQRSEARRSLAPRVIVPNLKRRLSGVTATIVRLLPLQARSINIAAFGLGLPDTLPRISLRQLLCLPSKTQNPWRVWHARRNTEMLLGLCLKHSLRKKFKLLFTSASQRVHTRYTRFLISKMDAVVSVSKKTKSYLKRPSTIIMHGIDTDAFQPPADRAALRRKLGLPAGRLLIGCFGRIRHQKGTDVFVDAMLDALPRLPNATAILLGRAAIQHLLYLRRLRQKIARKGLAERIRFRREVPVRQIAQWYQALDLFIAPQRWEGFGLTPLEAMSCGVPVIATKVGAFEEIIQEKQTGLLVAPGCAAELSQAVQNALSNPNRLKIWSENARARILKNFRLETEAQALNQLYRRLLNEQNAAGQSLENPS